MKIAVISDHIPSEWAHSINTVKHSQAFFNLGHEVKILAVERLEEKYNMLKIKDIHNFYGLNPQITIKFFRDNSFLYFRGIKLFTNYSYILTTIIRNFLPSIYNILAPEKRISDFCMQNNISLAYCRRTYEAAIYNLFNKIPTIIETHDFKDKKVMNPYLKKLLKLSNNRYFKGIVTIHENLKKKFLEFGVPKEKILVLEDAVDLYSFDKIEIDMLELRRYLKLPLNKKIVLYCGSLHSGKAIGDILKVAKRFDEKIIFYIIGGTDKNKKYWQKKAKREHIKNIKFLGFKENPLVPIYLKSADILLIPYNLIEKNTVMDIYTTSPLKLFEYMAAKKPIISSAIPTIDKIVQHKKEALLAKPGDINEIVDYIELLLENNLLAKKLAKNAYNKVKEYTYLKRCEKILRKLVYYENDLVLPSRKKKY